MGPPQKGQKRKTLRDTPDARPEPGAAAAAAAAGQSVEAKRLGSAEGIGAAAEPAAAPAAGRERYFRPLDWAAFGVTFLVVLGLYVFTLAPTVTLEDSGELVVAADYAGVPHPPGYPVWTILAWLFTRIFKFVKYHGYPNPAYGVNFTSAFFGAFTCALVSLMVSRSGVDVLEEMRGRRALSRSAASALSSLAAVSAGLTLGFGHLMWSQSVIAEVYTLNTFLHVLIFLLAYLWLRNPADDRLLCVTSFLFGVTITNCQPVILITMPLLAIFWRGNRELFRDSLAAISPVAVLYVIIKIRDTAREIEGPMPFRNTWELLLLSLLALATVAWAVKLAVNTGRVFSEWRRLVLIVVFIGLGLLAFVYMPLASDRNPPMNWGYTRTWEGFKHAVTRGQYQKLDPAVLPSDFLRQAAMYFTDLELRYSFLVLLPGAIVFFLIHRLSARHKAWFVSLLMAFFFLGPFFMALLNPGHDIQSLFIAKVQFIQADAVLCIWLGYSLLLGFLALYDYGGETAGPWKSMGAPALGVLAAALLPAIPVWKNFYDKDLVRAHSCAELNGHDFGWQFGYYQLRGANGIREELSPDEPPLPNPAFPPEMTAHAIFFGGTDPGRFVPTYMIYSARCRSDVFLITQNALADNTYMHVMRDLYGDLIWMPSATDCNNAFQRYVQEVREGKIPPNAAVTISPDGRVSVQGVQGVMEINGLICRMIFEANKHKHDFYVEESYVIPWMYPYLEPHGLIMKLNSEPLPELPAETVRDDREFWDWYAARLLKNPKFQRDMVAQKTFSKLRCAIAGIYAFRRMSAEAEYAFRQAIELYPLSPEANFRLADLYIQHGRFGDAIALMEAMARGDRRNTRAGEFAGQIRQMKAVNEQISQLQAKLQQGQGTLEDALNLAGLFLRVNRQDLFNDIAGQILNNTGVPPEAYLRIAEMYKSISPPQYPALAQIYRRYLERNPAMPAVWVELACAELALNNPNAAFEALQKAVSVGGEPVRDILRKDPRLNPMRHTPEFQRLVAPQSGLAIPGFPF